MCVHQETNKCESEEHAPSGRLQRFSAGWQGALAWPTPERWFPPAPFNNWGGREANDNSIKLALEMKTLPCCSNASAA